MRTPPGESTKSRMRRTPPSLQKAVAEDPKNFLRDDRKSQRQSVSPRMSSTLLFPLRIVRPLFVVLVTWLTLVVVLGPYSHHGRLMTLYNDGRQGATAGLGLATAALVADISLVFPNDYLLFGAFLDKSKQAEQRRPWSQALPKLEPSTRPRYNGLKYKPGRWANHTKLLARRIRVNDDDLYHEERAELLQEMDDETDEKDISSSDPGRYDHYEERDYPRADGCYRPKWSYEQHSACNSVHEQMTMDRGVSDLQRYQIEYLGEGHFRSSFRFTAVDATETAVDSFVLKNIKLNKRRNYNAFTFDQIQIEELGFMQTQASELTTNMYARCGTSVVVESGQQICYSIYPVEDNFEQKKIDKVQKDDVVPFNKLTSEQKLKAALQMAEALALLHGNNEGVIVNDDVQVDQWLLGADGNLKLNDFNNAVIMKWNPTTEKYCHFRVCYEYIYRSPQEVKRRSTDESADVFALGMILYTILTGFMPFYEREDWDDSMEALQDGEKPFVDPRYRNRSLIESRLVEIMEPTWEYNINDRANIFQVVQGLRDTVADYEKLHPGVKIRNIDLTNLPTLDGYYVYKEDYIKRLKALRKLQQTNPK